MYEPEGPFCAVGVRTLDGGLATELENAGHSIAHPLWSGKLLRDDPAAIKQAHRTFFEAGASFAITASYQTSTRGLRQYFNLSEADAAALIRLSVRLAQEARQECYKSASFDGRALLVAGSVGPYGAYLADGSEYRGDYTISLDNLRTFHKPRIQALVDAGADLLAIETIPSFAEVKCLLQLIHEDFPGTIAWLSCTLRDAEHVADSTSVRQVIEAIQPFRDQIIAFGINCVPPDLVSPFLLEARKYTDMPLVCYPNSGEKYDPVSKTWSDHHEGAQSWSTLVKQWHSYGAAYIGGCCRTGPQDIKEISRALKDINGALA